MPGVTSIPIRSKRSRRTSPVEEAEATITLTLPKRVLSWWWSMSITSGAGSSTDGSGPIRRALAQSSARTTRSPASSGRERRMPSSCMNVYSCGSGVSPERYMTTSLPSCSSASFMARIDPSESPSGFSCVVIRKRSWDRTASATSRRSVVPFVFAWRELIYESREPNAPLYRRIVLEHQLWSSLETELSVHPALKDAVRRFEALEGVGALRLRSQHAHVDGRVPEVAARFDARDGDEADPGVLEVADPFRQDLFQRFVDPSHAISHRALPPCARPVRARIPARRGSARRRRGAPGARCGGAKRTRRSAVPAATRRGGRPRRPRLQSAAAAGPSPREAPSASPSA